jgi:hypothetical protein
MGRAIVNVILPVEVVYDENGVLVGAFIQLNTMWYRINTQDNLRTIQAELDKQIANGEIKLEDEK